MLTCRQSLPGVRCVSATRIDKPQQASSIMIVFIGKLHAATSEKGTGGLHRYGLVYTRSEGDSRKVIKRVHGKVCHGSKLQAREFGQRLAGNERRRLDWRDAPWDGVERRRGERRTSPVSAVRR
jgi:hypothetical protein